MTRDLLILIWFAVAFFLISLKIITYARFKKNVLSLGGVSDKAILSVWEELIAERPSLKKVQLKKINVQACSPFVIGIIKPVIVIPDIQFTSEEYRYILTHEALHYLQKDIFIKTITDIICIFYWWNPLFRLIETEVFDLVEITNDTRVTSHYSVTEKKAYINCLLNTIEKLQKKPITSIAFALPLTKSNCRKLKQRIDLIVCPTYSSHIARTFIAILLSAAIIFSTSFIFISIPFALLKAQNVMKKRWLLTAFFL